MGMGCRGRALPLRLQGVQAQQQELAEELQRGYTHTEG